MILNLAQDYLLPILFFTGLLAGTVDAIAGGGGLISVPVLFSIGIPPHLALGTNKLQGCFGTAIATYSYYRQGWLKRQGLVKGIVYSFIGAVLGAIVSQYLSSAILKKIIPVLLFLVLLYTFFSPKLGSIEEKPKMTENGFYFIFGSLLGFYDGFFGPGTGSFWLFLLVFFLGQNLLKATAYTKVFNLNTNLAAIICFALGNNIDYKLAFFMAIGQVIGGWLGAYLAIRKGVKLIRPIFLLVVTSTIITLLYRSFANSDDFLAFASQPNVILFLLLIIISSIIIFIRNALRKRKALL